MERMKGKVAVITGAANGIGRETARLLAREGATIAIFDIDAENGAKVAEEIGSQGSRASFHEVDVTDEAAVQASFEDVWSEEGKIDVLVNCAGIIGPAELPDQVKLEDFKRTLEVDCTGTFITCKNVIRYLRENGGGSIVNIASISGIKAVCPGTTPYHTAKGAVVNMTRNFSYSYAKENIRVNCVCPGTTMTDLVKEDLMNKFGDIEEGAEAYGAMHPMGHLGEPVDTAYAILYLASDEAKWTTGIALSVDGGWGAI